MYNISVNTCAQDIILQKSLSLFSFKIAASGLPASFPKVPAPNWLCQLGVTYELSVEEVKYTFFCIFL